jgi:hypothetical protein
VWVAKSPEGWGYKNAVNKSITKAGIEEQEEAVVARQLRGKHISVATNQHATIEVLSEAVFYAGRARPI